MITSDAPSLEFALAIAQRLSRADRATLIARLALELGAEGETATTTALGDARAVVAAVLRAGPWEGDDLEQRLQEVYAARAPLSSET